MIITIILVTAIGWTGAMVLDYVINGQRGTGYAVFIWLKTKLKNHGNQNGE